MRQKDTQEQTKPVFNLYKDSLEDVIDNNIYDRVSGQNNLLWLSKSSELALELERTIPLLFRLFDNGTRAINGQSNDSSILLLGN